MRLRLLGAFVVLVFLASGPPPTASAASLPGAEALGAEAVPPANVLLTYYYHGHYYPYQYRGKYYRHRAYSHGRWRYY
jgi:hypothetical protein